MGVSINLNHYNTDSSIERAFSSSEFKNINLITVEYPEEKLFPGHYLFERYQYSKRIASILSMREPSDFIYAKGFPGWAMLKNRQRLKIKSQVRVISRL